VISWARRRDWRAGLIAVAFFSQYLPWFLDARTHYRVLHRIFGLAARTNFLFYMAPMTPFMVLGVVYGLKAISEARIGVERIRALAPVAAFLILVSIGIFAFFFPVLTGRTISYHAWQLRMWFGDCSPEPSWCWI